MALATDGREWTVKGVTMLLGLEDDSQANQFLNNLKTRLVIERSEWRLEKRKEHPRTYWRLTRR